jgi:hypothetical protein
MTATPDRHDGESFRVTHRGYWIGYAQRPGARAVD